MKKLLGIFIFVALLYGLILGATDPARWGDNTYNLGQRIGLSGILCLGAGLLIITGGVDLSIGSVVGLCACIFCWPSTMHSSPAFLRCRDGIWWAP